MKWEFELSGSPEFIRITTSGEFNGARFGEMFDELMKLDYWRPRIPLLFDHQDLDLSKATPTELMKASNEFIFRNSDFAFTPMAILFANSIQLEIGERFGDVTECCSQADIRRYLKESDAVCWIGNYFQN